MTVAHSAARPGRTAGPSCSIEQLIEDGDCLVALNHGRFVPQHGAAMTYVSAEAYTFTGSKISRIQTYQPMS